METTQKPGHKNGVSPEQKYIRIQITGMAIFLSWLPAVMLADMYGLRYIIPHLSVLILIISAFVFSFGTVGKQELRERNTRER